MKKSFYLLIVFSLFSCHQDNENLKPIFVGLIIDRTDTFSEVRNFNTRSIFQIMNLEKEPNVAVDFVVASISNSRYNLEYRNSLEQAPGILSGNELDRIESIDTFKAKVEKDIDRILSEPIGLNGSYVFYALSQMINKASKTNPTGEKTILVLSDLADFTVGFNGLKETALQSYKSNPEKFNAYLDKEYPIDRTQNMKIIFVHVVTSKQDDNRFFILSSLLRNHLESKGIQVQTCSNLNL